MGAGASASGVCAAPPTMARALATSAGSPRSSSTSAEASDGESAARASAASAPLLAQQRDDRRRVAEDARHARGLARRLARGDDDHRQGEQHDGQGGRREHRRLDRGEPAPQMTIDVGRRRARECIRQCSAVTGSDPLSEHGVDRGVGDLRRGGLADAEAVAHAAMKRDGIGRSVALRGPLSWIGQVDAIAHDVVTMSTRALMGESRAARPGSRSPVSARPA